MLNRYLVICLLYPIFSTWYNFNSMTQIVPEEIIKIYHKFYASGFKLYLVGGSVRNILLYNEKASENIKDWDLTTNATPDDMLKLFPDAFYDNAFGTVGVPVESLQNAEHAGVVEITTFRTERGYDDRRHPNEIKWGETIDEDLARRDFTMNAIAYEFTDKIPALNTAKSIDPYGGEE